MIGRPETGGYVLYRGDHTLFERHCEALGVPVGARFVGTDPGHAAPHDVTLLSAMTGMFAGLTHAFALVAQEKDLDRARLMAWPRSRRAASSRRPLPYPPCRPARTHVTERRRLTNLSTFVGQRA